MTWCIRDEIKAGKEASWRTQASSKTRSTGALEGQVVRQAGPDWPAPSGCWFMGES